MFENFKRMATPRNITILMAIIGVFILIMVLKYFNLYEGLTGADAAADASADKASADKASADKASADKASADKAAADKAAADKAAADKAAADNVSLTPTVGPSTNGPLIK